MTTPTQEYGWMIVGKDDFEGEQEYCFDNDWFKCELLPRAYNWAQRRRRIPPGEGFRILVLDESIWNQKELVETTFNGVDWAKHWFARNVETVQQAIQLRSAILAIRVPVLQQLSQQDLARNEELGLPKTTNQRK